MAENPWPYGLLAQQANQNAAHLIPPNLTADYVLSTIERVNRDIEMLRKRGWEINITVDADGRIGATFHRELG